MSAVHNFGVRMGLFADRRQAQIDEISAQLDERAVMAEVVPVLRAAGLKP